MKSLFVLLPLSAFVIFGIISLDGNGWTVFVSIGAYLAGMLALFIIKESAYHDMPFHRSLARTKSSSPAIEDTLEENPGNIIENTEEA